MLGVNARLAPAEAALGAAENGSFTKGKESDLA
jgi:hypothetical protein